MVVEYLRNRRLRADAPLPVVPQMQKRNMELLAEAWTLGIAFSRRPLEFLGESAGYTCNYNTDMDLFETGVFPQ